MNAVFLIARETLFEAYRDRIFWLFAVVLLIGVGLSLFLSEATITETVETQIALSSAYLRLATVLVMGVFVSVSIAREANDGLLQMLLALPLPRAAWYLGRLGGFVAVGTLVAIAAAGTMLPWAPASAAARWALALACELWVVVAFALLVSVSLARPTAALALTIGFYLLARAMGALLLISDNSRAYDPAAGESIVNGVLHGLSHLLPRLDQYARAEWLIYPDVAQGQPLSIIAVGSLLYLALLAAAGLFDLYRRNL